MMAGQGRQGFEKRQREKKKKEKRQEKLDRRAQRKADKENSPRDESEQLTSVNDIVPVLEPAAVQPVKSSAPDA